MTLYQWSLLLLVIVNLLVVLGVVFNAGKWKATIEQRIEAILERLCNFEKRYGDLPERVAKLEGWLEGKQDNI